MNRLAELRPLLAGHWYDAIAALLAAEGQDAPAHQRALSLAVAAKRVLDLDAEDFGEISEGFADRPWANALEAACFPPEPSSPRRGALASLMPLYALMLEVLELRAARREPLQVVVTAHLMGEYMPQLAWETVFGHAGDPLRLGASVGERWGSTDPACPHTSALRATARRALNAAQGDKAGYTAYLDRFHSRQGAALAVCALNHATIGAGERPDVGTTCPNPCAWATRPDLAARKALDARVRVAMIYRDSPLVALRHHAPVGHFFGVPSRAEIEQAWELTWSRLIAPWPDGANPLRPGGRPIEPGPGPLPGMTDVINAVAGVSVAPGRVIRTMGDEIAECLRSLASSEYPQVASG